MKANSHWFRREESAAAPALLRYAPALVIVAIAVADCGRYADTDLWGHIFFGNAMIDAGHLIRRDPYSYSAPGHLWLSHEWLSELLMASIYNALGAIGLKLMKFVCTAATIVFIAAAEGETGALPVVQFAVLIAVAIALIPLMQFRPQLFTFAFTAALLAGIARDNYGRRAPLWIAIPAFALWANLHGGFFIGILVLVIYSAVRAAIDIASGRGMKRALRLGAITIASVLATLATPYGIGGWYTVAHSLTNPMTRRVMDDWRPLMVVFAEQMRQPHSGVIFLSCGIAIIAALALSLILAPRGDDLALVAIAAVMAVAAFMSIRNLPLAVIASSAPLARRAGILARRLRVPPAAEVAPARISAPQRMATAMQAIAVALAAILALDSGLFSTRLPTARSYPAGAVTFMREHDLHGNIFNEFAWGQYLIWHLSPASKIFIDGRFDLAYPPEIVTRYLDFYNGDRNAVGVLETYPHDFVLIPPDCAAAGVMAARADWRLVYRDRVAALYARAGSRAAAIPAQIVTAHSTPSYFP